MTDRSGWRNALVFDIGTHAIRCGYQSNVAEVPKLTIPSLVAFPRQRGAANTAPPPSSSADGGDGAAVEAFCGLDAVRMRSVSTMRHPIRDGRIHSHSEFRLLLTHVCEMFCTTRGGSLADTPAVVTEPLSAHKSFRQEVASILFDLKVPAVLFVSQGLSSLFAVGELSGVIVDIGEDSSRCIAAVDGIGLPTTHVTTSLGGESVTAQMRGVLQDGGQQHALDYATQIKEAVCEVAVDTDAAALAMLAKGSNTRDFALPDSQVISISASERVRCAEVLFSNSTGSVVGGGGPMSITQIIEESVYSCDDIVRPHLLSRLHYCGSTASLPGFEARLLHELHRPRSSFATYGGGGSDSGLVTDTGDSSSRYLFSVPQASTLRGCRVHPSDRTWAGAAIFSSLSSARALFTTQREYQDQGPAVLGRYRQLAQ